MFGLIGSLTLNPPFFKNVKKESTTTHTLTRHLRMRETTENFAIGKLVCASFQDGSVNPSVKFIQRHSTYSLDTSSATHSVACLLTAQAQRHSHTHTLFNSYSHSLTCTHTHIHVHSFVRFMCILRVSFFPLNFYNSSLEHSVLTPQYKNFFCLRFFLDVYIIIYI